MTSHVKLYWTKYLGSYNVSIHIFFLNQKRCIDEFARMDLTKIFKSFSPKVFVRHSLNLKHTGWSKKFMN